MPYQNGQEKADIKAPPSTQNNPLPKYDSSAPGAPELLIREADHRISNSLQMIAALLSSQERRIGDDAAREALADARRRVTTVAHLHRHLCEMDSSEYVDLDDFLHGLFDDLRRTFIAGGPITLLVNADPVIVSPTMARDLGLIVHELATNALKHSFPSGREGLVEIACGLDANGEISLDVSDDGVGYRLDDSPAGLGMKMVELILAQLHGHLDIVKTDSQLIHKVIVPLP